MSAATHICEHCSAHFTPLPHRAGRFCSRTCYYAFRLRPEQVAARFWAHVDKTDNCWRWLASFNSEGYGRIVRGRPQKTVLAHRFAYTLIRGSIPDGLVLDHLCHNRWCVNPDHLEPVTQRENFLRGESPLARAYVSGVCKRGHVRKDNAYVRKNGEISCRACARLLAEVRRSRV